MNQRLSYQASQPAPAVLPEARTLTQWYRARAAQSPADPAFHSWADGRWSAVTWAEFVAQGDSAAAGLRALGLTSGGCVGLMAPTGLDWERLQFGALACGAAVLGLEAHDAPDRLQHVIGVAGIGLLVVGSAALFARLPASALADVRTVVCLTDEPAPAHAEAGSGCSRGPAREDESRPSAPRWVTRGAFESLAAAAAAAPQAPPDPAAVASDQVATVVFTSGSSGAPRGVAYTHAQVLLAVRQILDAFPCIGPGDRLACWLPLSNLFQRMINFCAAGGGAQTYFVSDPREIMAMLPRIRPHVFVGVPRFFEKFDAGVQQQLAEGPAWQRALVQRALAVGDAAARARRGGQAPGLATRAGAALADRLVLARLRQLLGGELRFLVSGSAPLPRWLAERFHAMGLLTLEAYGLSENIVPIAVNRRADFGFGTVGRVLPANEVRLAADGEVLVRGAGVFAGYLGGSADERRVDAEGFLHTGDLGAFDTNGRLCLLGRKSEVFKTSTGRKVVPAPIESRLKQLGAIDHAVVLGASRKVVTALVTPVAEQLPVLADDATWLNWAQALARRVRSEMGAQTGPGGGGLDRPGALLVLRGALSIEHGELTSNLKLRREPIARRHAPAIDALYERLERGGPFCEPIGPDLLIVSC